MGEKRQATEQQLKNLKTASQRTKEELSEMGKKGAKASLKARAKNRTMKAALAWALEMEAFEGNPTVDKLRRRYSGLTNTEAMAIAITAEAIQKQNVKAFTAVCDVMGETEKKDKPQPVEITIKTI